ncbi:hypothetical protein L1887_31880 [Cichorium endivia]|nr:hypothetical protein L1887_31880 [Cichorium endivia]
MPQRMRERDFKVVIKLASRADLHHLDMFLQGRQADAPQEALQVLDIVLRELHTNRFPVDDGGTMKSVVKYFRETYGFSIQHMQWPCLQVGNTNRPNYLPMEICKIVEGKKYSKRLNERQITALLKVTCQRPQEREKDILKTVNHNAYGQDPTLQVNIKLKAY